MARNKDFFVNNSSKRDRSFFVNNSSKRDRSFFVKEEKLVNTSLPTKAPQVDNAKKINIENRMSELDKLMKDTDTKLRRIGYTEAERANFQNQYSTYKQEYYSLKKELDAMNPVDTKVSLSELPKSKFYREGDKLVSGEDVEEMNRGASVTQKLNKALKYDIPMMPERAVRTAGDIYGSAVSGAASAVEGIADFAVGNAGTVLSGVTSGFGLAPNKVSSAIKDGAERFVEKDLGFQGLVNEVKNEGAEAYEPKILGVKVRDIANNIANMLTASRLGGVAGFVMSAGGRSIQEALNEGQGLNRAAVYGNISGALEGVTEKLFDAVKLVGGGKLDKFLPKSAIGKLIGGAAGEGMEEMITEGLNPLVKYLTYESGSVELPSLVEWAQNVGRAGWEGFVIGLLLKGGQDVSDASVREQYKNEVVRAVDKFKNLTQSEKNVVVREMVSAPERASESLLALTNGNEKSSVRNASREQNIQEANVNLPTQAEMAQRANMGQIDMLPTKFAQEVDEALNNSASKGNIIIGKTNNYIVDKVKQILGIDVTNRNHVLSKDYIRHMKKHMNETSENQISITVEDIKKVPDIINNPDDVIRGSDTLASDRKTKIPSIRYIKTDVEGKMYVIEAIPNKGSLQIKTMWKEPTELIHDTSVLHHTPEAVNSNLSTINDIIPNNETNINTQYSPNASNDTADISMLESRKGNTLPTQKAQETLQSARLVGMSDVDVNKAIALNKLLQSGASLKFYDPNNIPQGVDIARAADANGFYQNGTLWLNKNSEMKVERILGHELTHHVENDDLINTILDSNIFYDFLSEKGFSNTTEFKNYLMEKKGYKQHELNSEMVAHFAEEKLFGKEETINRLARENRTLAQKILNWLSDLRTKIAGSTEAKELLRIENMYRKALEQARSMTNTSNISYSIGENVNGQFVKVDTDQDIFDGINEKDYNKIAKMYIKDYLIGDTPLGIEGDIATIDSKTANKYTNPGKKQKYFNEKMKLTPELKNVLQIAKKDSNAKPIKENSKYANWEYYTVNFEIAGRMFECTLNIGVDSNGGKHLYEINKIHPVSILQTSANRSNEMYSNNSIPQNDDTVNVEYSLNNQKDTAGKEPAFSMPETDSQGRKLSKEQSESHILEDVETFLAARKEAELWKYDSGKELAEKAIEFYSKYQDGVANRDTFFFDTIAEFDKVEKRPNRKPDYVSHDRNGKVSSEYWYEKDGVIRGSDHWGKDIASCDWYLKGLPYSTDIMRTDKLYGFASWDSFVHKASPITIGNDRILTSFNNVTGKGFIKHNGAEWTYNKYDKEWQKVSSVNTQYAQENQKDTAGKEPAFSMPETDSQGRKLTKQQEEFFKDSKVRDENGNLQVVYHGTSEQITIFSKERLGETTKAASAMQGFFFTSNKTLAEQYSHYSRPKYITDLEREYQRLEKIAQRERTKEAWDKYNRAYEAYEEAELNYTYDEDNVRTNAETQIEAYLNLANPLIKDFEGREYRDVSYNDLLIEAKEKGHDGAIFLNTYDGAGEPNGLTNPLTNVYVAFKPNQIKEVTNTNPTENPDIRYSMNPVDIAKNPPNPQTGLDSVAKKRRGHEGDRISKFAESVQSSSIFSDELKRLASENIDINTYDRLANKDVLREANDRINEGGQAEVMKLLSKDVKSYSAKDVAEAILLIDRYQQVGDYESAIEIMTKLRMAGTSGGQMVQIFSLLGRMTPEGMTYYAQKELSDAYDEILKHKTQAWADEHADEFKLNDRDIEFIQRRVNQASKLPEGRDKYVLLAEIAERVKSKIPPQPGQSIKALARNSMLLNPKTMVRNVLGNVVIAPNHIISDFIGAGIDKAISKKTGVRTTGIVNAEDMLIGAKKGFYESFDDFRRGISTREVGNDRFEIQNSGRNFNENNTGRLATQRNAVAKALNGLDRVTGYLLESGDRPFYEAWFINSLNNQMKLNNVTEPTAEMIEIATDEALQRTWQDSNTYTKAVTGVRNTLNKFNIKGYGLGDMVMPFVKTPANLTKAVVDFSPLGAINAALKTSQFAKDIGKGVATSKQQREVVKAWSQVITGTLGMAIMTALANAGVLTGGGDDDKDVRSFEQNVLGIKPYSIKIGDKSYTYDWAQPLGTSAAMVADTVKSLKNATDNESKVGAVLSGLQSGASVLLEQSFVSSIRNLFEEDNLVNALIETATNEPSKFTPQLLGQVAQVGDDKARTSYVYDDKLATGINKVKAKIPGLRQTLEPSVDVLGREVETDNSIGNVMFNPANTAFARSTKGAEEMYRVYQSTGDKAVIAQVAPYYFNVGSEKIVLTPKQRTQFQKTIGGIASSGVESLLENRVYVGLPDVDKAEILKELYSYGNAIAKEEASSSYLLPGAIEKIRNSGMSPEEYILMKYISSSGGTKKDEMYGALISAGYSKSESEAFLSDYRGYKFEGAAGSGALPTLAERRAKLPSLKK